MMRWRLRPPLLAVTLLLVGCSSLATSMGYQRAFYEIPRRDVDFRAGRVSMLYDLFAPSVLAQCTQTPPTLSVQVCQAGAIFKVEYDTFARLYERAGVEEPPPDPARVLAAGDQLLRLVGPLLLKAATTLH